jgi:hypothetical protein
MNLICANMVFFTRTICIHDVVLSHSKVSTKIDHLHFPIFQDMDWWKKWHMLYVDHVSLGILYEYDLVFHNTNLKLYYTSTLFFLFCERFDHVPLICIHVIFCNGLMIDWDDMVHDSIQFNVSKVYYLIEQLI